MKQLIPVLLLAASLAAAPKADFKDFAHDFSRQAPANGQTVLSYSGMLKEARKSVVNISIQKNVRARQAPLSPFLNDPFFRQFFDDRAFQIPKERIERSLGSGVIVSENGYIITNNHVIDGADKVIVALAGSREEYEAEIIGTDPKSDLAVIKIDAKNLRAMTFFDSDRVEVGDVVFAIGNPFGVGETVTSGIVSATNRTAVGIVEYEDFIQTDAAINPGNSGGALVNSTGALIGINSAILTRSGASHGVGFSIPSNMVKQIATALIENGEFVRAWLGVSIADLEENLQEFYNRKEGAVIMGVEPGSPADKAGIKRGDLIVKVGSRAIANAAGLRNAIGSLMPGQKVKIELVRDGKVRNITAELTVMNRTAVKAQSGGVEYRGLTVVPLSDDRRAEGRIGRDVQGVMVSQVAENSAAAKAGFQPGDVVIQVESSEITDVDEFKKAVATEAKKRIYVMRRNTILIAVL
ncbi:MAG: Do family serine endopeptidase [Campylobacterales bacterium]